MLELFQNLNLGQDARAEPNAKDTETKRRTARSEGQDAGAHCWMELFHQPLKQSPVSILQLDKWGWTVRDVSCARLRALQYNNCKP